MIGLPEEGEKEAENIFESKLTEDFLNLGKETDIQVQRGQRGKSKVQNYDTIACRKETKHS